MPWREVTIPLQRLESATLATGEGANRRPLCRRSGISPKTGCKWLHRFQEGGPDAFQARSRRPHHSQQPYADNSILWGNTASAGAQIYNDGSITPTSSYSLVQSGCPSEVTCDSILDADAQFVDANGLDDTVSTLDGNLRLQHTSPAIDAGDNTAVPAGVTTDLDGQPRFVDIPDVPDTGLGPGAIVDMGAYEAKIKIYLPLVLRNYAP